MSQIQTVLGGINPDDLGLTLYHEHLAMKPGSERVFEKHTFDDPVRIANELAMFKRAGGGTFVEMSPLNFGRNIQSCIEISKNTGVHVICCTGFHKQYFVPGWVHIKSIHEIEAVLLREIQEGMDGTGVKAGVIKVGTSHNKIYPIEEWVIKAACAAQKNLNIPISTHCDKGTMTVEQCELILGNEVRPDRVLIGYADFPNNSEKIREICALGFNAGIDHVGRDLKNHDQTKIGMIRELIEEGYIEQVFISGDMGKKDYLKTYGGEPGLAYIPTNFKEYFL